MFSLDVADSKAAKAIAAAMVFTLPGATHAVVTWQAGYRDWYLEIW